MIMNVAITRMGLLVAKDLLAILHAALFPKSVRTHFVCVYVWWHNLDSTCYLTPTPPPIIIVLNTLSENASIMMG